MKKVALVVLATVALVIGGCRDDEPTLDPALSEMLQQLEHPVTIRDDLARGRLGVSCKRFYIQNPTIDPVGILTIVSDPKSRKVQWAEWQATKSVRNFRVGQHHRYEVYYRDDGLIDSVAYSRPGRGDEGRTTFGYHYQDSVLRSIEEPLSSPLIREWHFSYQANGQLKKVFTRTGSRSETNEPEIWERSFRYDSLGNVTQFQLVKGSTVLTSITYTYDTSVNHFQGLFVLNELFSIAFPYALAIGPVFLSANNVASATITYSSIRQETETYRFVYEADRLTSFYSSEQDTLRAYYSCD